MIFPLAYQACFRSKLKCLSYFNYITIYCYCVCESIQEPSCTQASHDRIVSVEDSSHSISHLTLPSGCSESLPMGIRLHVHQEVINQKNSGMKMYSGLCQETGGGDVNAPQLLTWMMRQPILLWPQLTKKCHQFMQSDGDRNTAICICVFVSFNYKRPKMDIKW